MPINSIHNYITVSQKLFSLLKSDLVEQNTVFLLILSKFVAILSGYSIKSSLHRYKNGLELCKLFACGFKGTLVSVKIYLTFDTCMKIK
jgi:hypothetical protein